MKRTDLLIAKLKAKQLVRGAVQSHQQKFAPPQPQQGEQNAPGNPNQTQTPPDQPAGQPADNGLASQP
jgi:hypothetical protein